MAGGGGRRRGPAPGSDAEVRIGLEFAEAVFGCRKEISVRLPATCAACTGRGTAPGTEPVVCPDCQGAGEIRRVRQSLLGQVVTSAACPRCAGTGETIPHPCPECGGEGRRMEEQTFTVEVPAGVDNGSTLRLAERGAAGQRGGSTGSLFVHLVVTPDPRFERESDNLHTTLTIGMAQAALGTEVEVDTLEGHPRRWSCRPGTQHGFVERIRGEGVPHLRGRGRGDLFVHVLVETPSALDAAQEELLRQFAAARGEQVSPPGHGRGRRVLAAPLCVWLGPVASGLAGWPPSRCVPPRRPRSSWTTRRTPSSRPTTPITSAGCCACGPARRSSSATGPGHWARTRWTGGAGGERGRGWPLAAVGDGTGPGRRRQRAVRGGASPALTVAFAPTKGERPEWVVQKLTELGIDRIVPLVSERSVVRWSGARGQGAVERLRRVAREAAGQCRRVWLPEITEVVRFDALAGAGGAGGGRAGPAERRPPAGVATGGGGGARRGLERGRAGVGPADRRLRPERAAGRDGRRDGRGAHGVTPHGYGGADGADGTRRRILLVGDQTDGSGPRRPRPAWASPCAASTGSLTRGTWRPISSDG